MGADAPPQPDYYKQTADTLAAQIKLAPERYASEAKYQPQYAALNLKNLDTVLNGNGQSPGLIAQYTQRLMPAQAAAQNAAQSSQRASDIADVSSLGPQLQAAQRAANPAAAQLIETMTTQAQSGLDAGSRLTADQQRQLNDQVRGAQSARGMAYGPAASYGEVLAGSQYGQQLLNDRTRTATNAVGLNQQFYGDPFMAILGRPSTASASSQGLLGTGNQMQPGSQFNPESPLSAGITSMNTQNMAAYNAANSPLALFSGWSSAIGNMVGSVAGGMMCWVAREVYGETNPQWLRFRRWLMRCSPQWFLLGYLRHGERIAAWLKTHPRVKSIVRRWMDARIATLALKGI